MDAKNKIMRELSKFSPKKGAMGKAHNKAIKEMVEDPEIDYKAGNLL